MTAPSFNSCVEGVSGVALAVGVTGIVTVWLIVRVVEKVWIAVFCVVVIAVVMLLLPRSKMHTGREKQEFDTQL